MLSASLLNAQQRNLAYYLKQAENNSPLINKNLNDRKIVELDLKQVRSILYKPEINIVSGITLAPIISHDNVSNHFQLVSDGSADYTGHDLDLTDGGQFQALLSVRQNLLPGSKYKAYSGKSDVSDQISRNNILLTQHEIQQLIAYQYILCLFTARKAENSLVLMRDMGNKLKAMEQLVENAVYKMTDLMILQIEVQNYHAEYESFRAEYLDNLYDLNLVCGISDTVRVELMDTDFEINSSLHSPSGFLISYKLDSLSILADQQISELKYKPQIELFADAGMNAAYLPSLKRMGLTTGISLSWNIFDGHQREIERGKNSINLQSVEFEKNNFQNQNAMQKNKIIKQIAAFEQKLSLNEQQAESYRQLYDAYSKQLSFGMVSIMDFKNLVKDVATNKQEHLQMEMERQFLINTYNYLNY